MDPQQAWLYGLATMLLVFIYFHYRTNDIRYSFMASLLWGKILAGIFWVLGLDYPLFSIYRYYEGYGYYPVVTITANMAILLLLAMTNMLAYAWPEIKRELGARGPLPGLPARTPRPRPRH